MELWEWPVTVLCTACKEEITKRVIGAKAQAPGNTPGIHNLHLLQCPKCKATLIRMFGHRTSKGIPDQPHLAADLEEIQIVHKPAVVKPAPGNDVGEDPDDGEEDEKPVDKPKAIAYMKIENGVAIFTVKELGEALEVEYTSANGFLRVMEAFGMIETHGVKRAEGAKGKGSTLYSLPVGFGPKFEKALNEKLVEYANNNKE